MQKVLFTFVLSLCFVFISTAQDFLIKGKVIDAFSKAPLEAATIYAESLRDSALVAYSISDQNGVFELEEKTSLKELNLYFSYNGYKTKSILLALKPTIDLGIVQMEEQAEELKGVSVVGERTPITIKKDTLEFNADSFKTRPDATVEDVLKKLPGVEVDSDGKITVNGKEVSQVLVNGQVFFSNDPKVATKSLPKDIISKIQILDTKTAEQEFTGEAGDGETKTINLTIKEDKNKGYLGRVSLGYGTDERYQGNALLNYFNDTERFSIIAGSNNINNAGFSFDEIYDMVGNSSGGVSYSSNGSFRIGDLSFGFGQGITTASNVGASYANKEKGKFEIGANYFFAYSDSFNDEMTSRENILPDSRFFTDSESNFNGSTNSNQGSADIEIDIDKTFRVSVEPSLSISRTNSTNTRNSRTTDENGNMVNSSLSATAEDGFQRNFSNELTLSKKLDTMGRYIRLSFENQNRTNINQQNLNTSRSILGDNASEETLDQLNTVDNDNDSYEVSFRYRHVLKKELFLDFGYAFENRLEQNTRDVFDFDEATGEYDNFNTSQSSDFRFRDERQIPYLGIRKDGKKLRYGLRAQYQFTTLDNEDFLQNTSFSKSYENVLLRGNINYTIGKNKRVSAWYDTNLRAPRVNQLQAVPNVSNPLNISIGNPNLNPSITSNINLNYNDYDWKERTGVFIYLGGNIEKDRVSLVTTTDENFLRTTRYTNVDGNYSGYGGFGYSKQIKKDSTYTVKFNIRPYLNFNRNIGFTNGSRLESKTIALSPRVSTTFNFMELVEIEPEYSVTFSDTKYNLEGIEDINFVSHNAGLKTTTYWPENVIWGNDINYTYNGNVGPGFDKDAIFWNMSLGVQLFKKNVTLKVLAYDLLNQNINTRRTAGQDFIQDFQGTVLQRYFMFSATFKFDQFGGKKPGGGGMRFF